MSKILFVGPYPPPLNGQSFVFKTVVDNFDDSLILNTSKYRSGLINFWYYFFTLIFLLFKYRVTLIYFTCSRSFFGSIRDMLLLTIAKILNIKTINHLHGSDFKQFLDSVNLLYRKIILKCYNHVDASVVLTNGMKEQFEDFDRMEKIIIPNFYPSSFDNIIRTNPSIHRVLFFSNIMRSKGIMEFLDLSEMLLSNNHKIEIDIAGQLQKDKFMSLKMITGIFFNKYDELKSKYGDRISYHGPAFENEKMILFSRSSFFVLPSYHEAFPISILEAMKSGNVIISSRTMYISEIMSEKNGLISSNIDEIYNYIVDLISNESEMSRIKNYNSNYVNVYSEERFIKAIKKVLMNSFTVKSQIG